MTDAIPTTAVSARTQRLQARLRGRYAREMRFKWYGRAAIGFALIFLVILLGSIIMQGRTAFYTHSVTLPVYMDPAQIDRGYPQGTNFEQLVAEQQLARFGVADDAQGSRSGAMRGLFSADLKFAAAEVVQKVYLGVGPVLDKAEARQLVRRAGAELT